ncbi:MAG TPA: cold shock domain-containing protein, partial [Burkholderiales bacterium]|nr:cold shock domain-containing protein [Burkholderiales bacterium]
DDRGYGFITPNGGGSRVFLHISAFKRGQGRPCGDELVTYELEADGRNGNRAANVVFVGPLPARASSEGPGLLRRLAPIALLAGLGFYGWQTRDSGTTEIFHPPAPEPAAQEVKDAPRFQCEGKVYCSQMTSCAEAMFYLYNCPGVKIDGNRDGIPCERQWC